jgi:hypothetical protein
LGLVLVAVAVIAVVSDSLGGAGKPSGVSDNTSQTSLATVRRQSLSSQTQVNATLGYAGAANIRVPTGMPPSAVQQAEQAVRNSERMLQGARASLSADSATPANAKARDEQRSSVAAIKIQGDRTALSSAQAALESAEASAAAARSAAADYGQSSIFTVLPAVGRVIARGQSLFALSGHKTVLLYGSVVPSRAFLAGMSPGRDVEALNANLDALGCGSGLSGDPDASVRPWDDGDGRATAWVGRVRARPGAGDERNA